VPATPSGAEVGVEALGDPALIVDGGSRIVAANAAARRVIGERAIGDGLSVALRHPIALEAVRLAREQGRPIEREVAGLGRQEGLYRLRVAAAGDARLLLTFSDISAARLAERMRVDFVANASHELRTPLATIMGFVETLQGPAVEDEPARRRFLDIMAREAGRMTRLIDDLLSLSRIELDKYVRPTTPVVLAPLLSDVGRTLAMRLEADQRKLTIESPADLPAVIGDRDQILQVLHNLVSNALKYGRSGTPIRLTAERVDRPQPMVRVAVADQGEGIAKEHLPRLTERFYRVDNSRSRSLGGTGLGLAIVKHIVERHRGELSVDSVEGEGTTVAFTLPQAASSESLSQS
jgi:two-component system, OmpR family, phosphate regulon sensor histidine kinase PhoR